MSRVQPDVVGLVSLYRWARDNPDEHSQVLWAERSARGSTACLAGKRVMDEAAVNPAIMLTWLHFQGVKTLESVWISGESRAPGDVAGALLGLTQNQADQLFIYAIGLAEIRQVIKRITGVDPETHDLAEHLVTAILTPDADGGEPS